MTKVQIGLIVCLALLIGAILMDVDTSIMREVTFVSR